MGVFKSRKKNLNWLYPIPLPLDYSIQDSGLWHRTIYFHNDHRLLECKIITSEVRLFKIRNKTLKNYLPLYEREFNKSINEIVTKEIYLKISKNHRLQ